MDRIKLCSVHPIRRSLRRANAGLKSSKPDSSIKKCFIAASDAIARLERIFASRFSPISSHVATHDPRELSDTAESPTR